MSESEGGRGRQKRGGEYLNWLHHFTPSVAKVNGGRSHHYIFEHRQVRWTGVYLDTYHVMSTLP